MIRLWKPASTIRGSCAPRLSDCSSLVVFNGLFQTSGYGQIRAQSTDPLRATSTASEWFVLNPRLEQKINYITKLYEDFIGLTEVKAAQAKVISAESEFKIAQNTRTTKQQCMMELQRHLREIHAELDKTVRGEDRHLQLVTKEHAILKEERLLVSELRATEKREHELFSLLSFALRESHEKERAQAEKTKYWSIIGSVVGTIIGIVASTINNQYRLHQLRKLVIDATSETAKCRDLIMQIQEGLNKQNALLKKSALLSTHSVSAATTNNSSIKNGANRILAKSNDETLQNDTNVSGSIDKFHERTVHPENVIWQTPLVKTALISATLVMVPLVGWMLTR
ncbi:coiled-coil domain-containing protein 51-like isoform X1 [Varroa destructor]|uniref:Coiled-coil domain-containing protein 51 n=1 Tax=Varroa destructor TaxID=109461 RepID=A0A7M7K3W4_VARDE|nr:coiled-coil domain-containing protein 51-like isoform X1 [Varroa destructor]XP_022657177.1 coiled-coil domain-containing protein 51-like isoform X1 [Varroa destructor]